MPQAGLAYGTGKEGGETADFVGVEFSPSVEDAACAMDLFPSVFSQASAAIDDSDSRIPYCK